MLTAGLAKVCIAPPPGVPLAGFAARQGNASGVHDHLYARACIAYSELAYRHGFVAVTLAWSGSTVTGQSVTVDLPPGRHELRIGIELRRPQRDEAAASGRTVR
jgi:hypothetical protein